MTRVLASVPRPHGRSFRLYVSGDRRKNSCFRFQVVQFLDVVGEPGGDGFENRNAEFFALIRFSGCRQSELEFRITFRDCGSNLILARTRRKESFTNIGIGNERQGNLFRLRYFRDLCHDLFAQRRIRFHNNQHVRLIGIEKQEELCFERNLYLAPKVSGSKIDQIIGAVEGGESESLPVEA